jgi:hypothetical protein
MAPTPRKLQYRTAATGRNSCPLTFAQNGLCADLQWTQGPTVDSESVFQVSFWALENGSPSKLTEPTGEVGAFIRMTCCGSVFFPKVTKVSEGKYLVSNVKFTPGKWEVYVQLKNGNAVEKQFVPVNLDE